MLTWQQIKRIRELKTKGKTPIWYRKLEETILEDQISRRIKKSYAQQEEINESQIKPKKRKMSYKRSKREWVIGQRKNNMGSFLGKMEKKSSNKKLHILEWEENKENLVLDNPS
ncbi:24869_t:CDS:1, partial [Gigaspora rosea]